MISFSEIELFVWFRELIPVLTNNINEWVLDISVSSFNVMIIHLILETSFGIITDSKLHNSAHLHARK